MKRKYKIEEFFNTNLLQFTNGASRGVQYLAARATGSVNTAKYPCRQNKQVESCRLLYFQILF